MLRSQYDCTTNQQRALTRKRSNRSLLLQGRRRHCLLTLICAKYLQPFTGSNATEYASWEHKREHDPRSPLCCLNKNLTSGRPIPLYPTPFSFLLHFQSPSSPSSKLELASYRGKQTTFVRPLKLSSSPSRANRPVLLPRLLSAPPPHKLH